MVILTSATDMHRAIQPKSTHTIVHTSTEQQDKLPFRIAWAVYLVLFHPTPRKD